MINSDVLAKCPRCQHPAVLYPPEGLCLDCLGAPLVLTGPDKRARKEPHCNSPSCPECNDGWHLGDRHDSVVSERTVRDLLPSVRLGVHRRGGVGRGIGWALFGLGIATGVCLTLLLTGCL